MFKWMKRIAAGVLIAGILGGVCVGTGFGSYLKSSGKLIKGAVKDSIPVEFEIQRARDLLEDLIPEMQANLRLVAAEEVDVASLEKEVERSREALATESGKVQKLRVTLARDLASYTIGGHEYRRGELVEDLARRFEHMRTAELLLGGKEDLLRNRKRSLDAALKKLDRTRVARVQLATQIEALEAQFRLVEAQSSGSEFRLDDSKLARTEKVIAELKKKLEITQRVLAREARFIEEIPIDAVEESSVVERVDAYFSKKSAAPATPALAAEAR
ncbi:MAG TPA: hypothetical protein VMT52_11465 [Planctomycetota bacterium]|nr:hypothetical protein [Planctomycetota bacterium]